jgi:hypothetical protein
LYRNRKLLDVLRESPYCWGCGCANDGTVVAAHINEGKFGKGRGIKAHDCCVAALCFDCHSSYDQGPMNYDEKQAFFRDAYLNTMLWLFLSGELKNVL